jgi:hypothetical protein
LAIIQQVLPAVNFFAGGSFLGILKIILVVPPWKKGCKTLVYLFTDTVSAAVWTAEIKKYFP